MIAGALYGASGVVLGAWGAHGLASMFPAANLDAWDTAVKYQLVHALALLLVGVLNHLQTRRAFAVTTGLFTLGVILFSGSIYGLVLGGWKVLGPITPMGGVAFIVGWLALLWTALTVETG